MALMVVENAESKVQAPPSGEMTETNVTSEPPPPGTEDEIPVLLSLKSLASGSGSALDEEPPPPGTEDDAPPSVQTSRNSLVVVTTSSSAIDDDHEEGEIDDDEDDERALEYEDISSEEETTIRERIAQLEAMDDELGKINQITGASSDDLGHFAERSSEESSKTAINSFLPKMQMGLTCDSRQYSRHPALAYDKPAVIDLGKDQGVYECISDEEDVELYLRRYEPIPKPKLLPPPRKRKARRSLRTSTRSISSDRRPLRAPTSSISSNRRPHRTSSSSISSDRRPVRTSTRSVSSERRPLRASTRSISSDQRPVRTSTRSISSDQRPVRTSSRSISSDQRPLRASTRSICSDQRPLRTSTRSISSDRRPLRASTSSSISSNRRDGHGDTHGRKAEKRRHEPASSSRKSSAHKTHHKQRKQHMGSSVLVNIIDSTDSEPDYHPLDRARLQVACNVNAGKRKTDKENWDALKQKLKLQMQKRKQKQSESSKEAEIITDEPMVTVADEAVKEDDEEVFQLRFQALNSTAELQEPEVINLVEDPVVPESVVNEEQQLRLDALRSAFTKKHEKRLQRKQGERPYSPSDELYLLASPIEDEAEDDEVQIIEKPTETVEIPDSSTDEEPESKCPEPPTFSPIVDMMRNDSSSPAIVEVSSHHKPDPKETSSPELEPPSPPVIGDLQSKLPEEDDEEMLRNHLLSNLSATALKPTPVRTIESRPMTPDSMAEEEADALRDLILSKMHKKASRNITPAVVPEVSQKTDSYHIPANGPETLPCEVMEPLTISVSDPLPLPNDVAQISAPALIPTVQSINQSKVQSNPNLITLIGKQKVTRKKRKKSLSAAKKLHQQHQQQLTENNQVVAIIVPRPSRKLIKAPIVQHPASPSLTVNTKKLLINPNKLINLNAPPRIVHSPKERSNLLDTYVQKPVAKMIIQVGQSDSDSDPDYYPAPDSVDIDNPAAEMHLQEAFLRDLDNASPSRVMLESPSYSPIPTAATPDGDGGEQHVEAPPSSTAPAPNNNNADVVPFEQRLDQFLKTVRSKIDQSQAVAAATATTTAVVRDEVEPAVAKAGAKIVTFSDVPMTVGSGIGSGRGSVGSKAARKPITAPAATPNTSSAVRHLPKSAQLEYRRLVARMAQLEKQKQQRIPVPSHQPLRPPPPLTKTIINTGPGDTAGPAKSPELVVTINRDRRDVVDLKSTNSTVPSHPQIVQQQPAKRGSEPLVKRVLINNAVIAERENVTPRSSKDQKINDKQPPPIDNAKISGETKSIVDDDIKQCHNQTVEVSSALRHLPALNEEDRLSVLRIAENRYEKHSQKFAHELQDLIGTVENAQAERQRQYDLENKVAFLREKLAVLERALTLHKKRLNVIFPELQESHAKVMSSRQRSIELNNLCIAIGREVQGSGYSPPSTARSEIHEQLKVLTTETKRLKDMKRLSLEEFKELTTEQRRVQHERQKHAIEQELVKSGTTTPEPPDQKPKPSLEHAPSKDDGSRSDTNESAWSKNSSEMHGASKLYAKSVPASRSASPVEDVPEQDSDPGTIETAAADIACKGGIRFAKYTSPLASLKNQSALNIPDGVICPYQMRGECIDQDCKFDHLK